MLPDRTEAQIYGQVTVYGLVVHAENALQTYEAEQRQVESALRREARLDLARRGLVATETEIEKWKAEKLAREASTRLDALLVEPRHTPLICSAHLALAERDLSRGAGC